MRAFTWVVSLSTLIAAGCLGTLQRDRAAEAVTRAPEAALQLAVRDSQIAWLFRDRPGWCGAHEVRFGGDRDDPAVLTVRAVRFKDAERATAAFGRLTPAYLGLLVRDRMAWAPRFFDYPDQLAGDAVLVMEYGARLPPEVTFQTGIRFLPAQLTAIRAGQTVILLESIGVTPAYLVPAVAELVAVAARVPDGCSRGRTLRISLHAIIVA